MKQCIRVFVFAAAAWLSSAPVLAQPADWLRQARAGDVQAQYRLGQFFEEDGRGTGQVNEPALHWYRLAAAQGHAESQYNLGRMYGNGLGSGAPQDDKEAVKWYRLSAAQGDSYAQNALGVMYEMGRGLKQDDQEAAKWYQLAAAQGYSEGMYRLAAMYDQWRGVGQDHALAAQWYLRAAEQGHLASQLALGQMYEQGRGVQQNFGQAYYWYSLQAQYDFDDLSRRRHIVARQLKPGERKVWDQKIQASRLQAAGK